MVALPLALGLAGKAGAAAITVAAPQVIGATQAGAYAVGGGEIDLGIQFFVGGVLLITAACFVWLAYLMLSCPPEENAMAAFETDTSFRDRVANDPRIQKYLDAASLAHTFDMNRQLRYVDAIFDRVFGTHPPGESGREKTANR